MHRPPTISPGLLWSAIAASAALAVAAGCGFSSNAGKPGGDDAGVDAPGGAAGDAGPSDTPPSDTPPATVCYGPSNWQVCLGAAPSKPVTLNGTLDTDKSDGNNPCLKNQPAGWTDTQSNACFIVGTDVTVNAVQVTGSRPLVIVAQDRITVASLLDVASHRATGTVGAGSASMECKPFNRNPASGPGGGGAGGSFMFPGADGGAGNGGNRQSGQAGGADVGAPARLRGGCPGQPGGGGTSSDGGAGGGAVYLVSAGMISIQGKIDVSGAGGAGGDAQDGGGGGGSGGMIVLYGSSVMTTAVTFLIANGGGGGGGGANGGATPKGSDGHEPILAVPIVAALGGDGGVQQNFEGGDGGKGYATSSNAVVGLNGAIGAGGGGGGGGGGYIQSNQGLGAAVVSPAATIKP